MKLEYIFLIVMLCVVAAENNGKDLEEARGKGKYALLTNLAIVLATKVGLYKIVLGIALVVASMKILVVMAWALAISKHVPNAWPSYKNDYSHHYYHEKIAPPIPSTVHFFYVVATKVFVLKIIYGIIFYVLLTKGWHFVLWFVHYLKKKKHEEYIDHEPVYYHGHDHGPHYDHEHHYEHQDFEQPYGYNKQGYGTDYRPYRKTVYDSDGSYSVKS